MDKEQKRRATSPLKKTARKSFIGPFNPGFLDNLPHTVLLACRKNAKETKQGINSKFDRQTKERIQGKPVEPSKDEKKRKCDGSNPSMTSLACVLSEGGVKQLESLHDRGVVDKENTSFSVANNSSSEKSKIFNPFKKLKVGAKIPKLRGDLEKGFNVNKVENGKFNNRFPFDKDTRNPVKKAIGVLSKTKRLPGKDINSLSKNLTEKVRGYKEDDLRQMSKVRQVCCTEENDSSNIKSKDRHKIKVKCTSSSNLSKTSTKVPGEPYNERGTKSQLHGKNKMDSKRPRDLDEKTDHSNKREHKQKVKEYHNAKTEIGKRKRLESDVLYSDPLRTNKRGLLSTDRAEKRKKHSGTTEKKDSPDSSVMNTSFNSKDTTTTSYSQTSTKKPDEVNRLTSTSKSKLMEEKKRSGLSIVCSDSQKDNTIKKRRHSSKSKTLKVYESVQVKDVKRSEHMSSDGSSEKKRHQSDSSKMSTNHRTKLSDSSALKKDKEKYRHTEKDKRKDQGKQNLDLKKGMKILEPHRSCTTEENSKECEKTLASKEATKHKRSKSVDTLGLSFNTLKGSLKHVKENTEIMDKVRDEILKKKISLLSDDVYDPVKFQLTGDSVSADSSNKGLPTLDNIESNPPIFSTFLSQKSKNAPVLQKYDSETENSNANLSKLDNIESKDASVLHKYDSKTEKPNADLCKLDNKESKTSVFPTSLCQKSKDAPVLHKNDSETEKPNADLCKLDDKESNTPVFPTPLSNNASGLNKNESETENPKTDLHKLNNVESNPSVFPSSMCQMSNTASVLPKNDPVIVLPNLDHVDSSVFETSMCQMSNNVLNNNDPVNVQRKFSLNNKEKFKSNNLCSKSDLSLKILKHHPLFCRIQKPISRFDYSKDIPEKLNLFEDSFEESFPESPDDRLFIATDDNESSDIGAKLPDDSDNTLPVDDDDDNSRPTDNLEIVNMLPDQISSDKIGSVGLPLPTQKENVQSNSSNLFDKLLQEGFPDEYAKQKVKGLCSQNSDDCGYVSVAQQSADDTPDVSVNEQLHVTNVPSLDISGIDENVSKNDSVLPDKFHMPSDTPEDGLNAVTLFNIKAEPGVDNGSSVLRNDGLTFSTPKKPKDEECLWQGNTSNIASVKEEYGSHWHSDNNVANLPNLNQTLSAPSSDYHRLPQLCNEIPTCQKDLGDQAMCSGLSGYKGSPAFLTTSNKELDSSNSLTQNSNSNVLSEEVLHQNVNNSCSYAGSNTSSFISAQFTERLMRSKQLREALFKQKEMPIPIPIYHRKKTSTGSLVETNGNLYPQLFYSRGNKCVCCHVCSKWISALEFMVHHDNLPPCVELNQAESLSNYQIQFRGELSKDKRILWNQFCRDLAKFKRWTNSEGPQSDPATSGTINSHNRTFEKSMEREVVFINGKVPKSTNDSSHQTTSVSKDESWRTLNPIDPLPHPRQAIEKSSAPQSSSVHRSYNHDRPLVVLHHGVSTESRNKHHGHFSRSVIQDQPCASGHGLSRANIQSAIQDPHNFPLGQRAVQDPYHCVSHQSTIQDQHHASHQSAVHPPHPSVVHLPAIPDQHRSSFRQSSVPDPYHSSFRQSAAPELHHSSFSQTAVQDPGHGSFRQSAAPEPHHSSFSQTTVQDPGHGSFRQSAAPEPHHSSFSQTAVQDPGHGSFRQSAAPEPHHSSFSQTTVQDPCSGSFSKSVIQDPHHDVSGQSTVRDQHYASIQSDVSNNSPLHDLIHGCSKSTTQDTHHGQSALCDPNHSIHGQSLESGSLLAQYPDNPLKSSYTPGSILDHPSVTGSNTTSNQLRKKQIASVDNQMNSEILPVSNSHIVSSLKNMETLELLSLSQKCHSRVLKRLLSERDNHSEEIKTLKLQLNSEIKGRMELQSSVTTLLSEVDKLKAFISVSQLGETRVPPSEK